MDKRHTIGERSSTRTKDQKKGSRFKVRRSSLSSIVYRSENRVNVIVQDEASSETSGIMALIPAPSNKIPDSRIPSSLQTSPSIPDKRFANISRLPPRPKNDNVSVKKMSRDEGIKSILSK